MPSLLRSIMVVMVLGSASVGWAQEPDAGSEPEQDAGTAPNYAMQVSRLRRAKDELLDKLGEVPYRVVYGNALWSIYILIGKLETRLYVLRGESA